MANYYKGHSLEELLRERRREYPPPPHVDQSAWHAARELWPFGPPALAPPLPPPPASSGSNNNNDNDNDLAVVRAGPVTAVPDEAIDPRLPSAAAAPPVATTTAAAPAPLAATAAPAPAAAAAAPAPAATGPAAAAAAQPGQRRLWRLAEDADLRARRQAGQGFGQIGQALNRTAAACETRAKVLRIFKG